MEDLALARPRNLNTPNPPVATTEQPQTTENAGSDPLIYYSGPQDSTIEFLASSLFAPRPWTSMFASDAPRTIDPDPWSPTIPVHYDATTYDATTYASHSTADLQLIYSYAYLPLFTPELPSNALPFQLFSASGQPDDSSGIVSQFGMNYHIETTSQTRLETSIPITTQLPLMHSCTANHEDAKVFPIQRASAKQIPPPSSTNLITQTRNTSESCNDTTTNKQDVLDMLTMATKRRTMKRVRKRMPEKDAPFTIMTVDPLIGFMKDRIAKPRRAFADRRRKEVAEVRKMGACFRCKIWNVGVSMTTLTSQRSDSQ